MKGVGGSRISTTHITHSAHNTHSAYSVSDLPHFHALRKDTMEGMFFLSIGMFPALFLLAQPQLIKKSVKDTTQDNNTGPFRSFITISQSYMWMLQQLENVLEEKIHLQFSLRVNAYCVRVTRAVLLCVEGIIQGLPAWRSKQALPGRKSRPSGMSDNGEDDEGRDDDSLYGDEEKEREGEGEEGDKDEEREDQEEKEEEEEVEGGDDEEKEEEADIGSVEHVASLLDWSLALTHRVIRYAETLKGNMLYPDNRLTVPRYALYAHILILLTYNSIIVRYSIISSFLFIIHYLLFNHE